MAVSFLKIQFHYIVCRLLPCGVLLAFCVSLFAQEPTIERFDGTGLHPGQRASVTVNGKQLQGALALWTPVGTLRVKEGSDTSKDQPVTLEGDIAADAAVGIYPVRMVTNHGCSEASWVVIDDLPAIVVTGEADDRRVGQSVALPCCVQSFVNPVGSKSFRFTLSEGQRISAEVFARRLSSDLDPVLRLFGPDGREVAYSDDLPGAEGDAQMRWVAPSAGEYRLEVRDIRYSGGGRYFFHLRLSDVPLVSAVMPGIARAGQSVSLIDAAGTVIGEPATIEGVLSPGALVPLKFRAVNANAGSIASAVLISDPVLSEVEPNDTREQATLLAADSGALSGAFQKKGDADWFRITATEAGPLLLIAATRDVASPCDLVLELYNADGGKLVEADDTGPRDAELSFQIPAAGDFFLKVSELAGRGGAEWPWSLRVYRGRRAILTALPADRLNVPRGGSVAMPLSVRRIQYDGPLKVEVTGLPPALKMDPFVVGPKQSTIPIVVTAVDPAATTSDLDWGPVSVHVSAPDGSIASSVVQLNPPPPKKQDNELFRSARMRSDLFAAVSPAAEFSLTVDPPVISIAQGASGTVLLKSVRAADWAMPIEVALATPADQLSAGVTVAGGAMAAGELAVTITIAADALPGPCTIFLQGKAKKDNQERVYPVPPIRLEVVPKI